MRLLLRGCSSDVKACDDFRIDEEWNLVLRGLLSAFVVLTYSICHE